MTEAGPGGMDRWTHGKIRKFGSTPGLKKKTTNSKFGKAKKSRRTCRKSKKLSATSVSLAKSAEKSTSRCSCRRQDSTYRDGQMDSYPRADGETAWLSDTCSSCGGWRQKKGRWRSKSTTGWSLSSFDGNTMVRGCK